MSNEIVKVGPSALAVPDFVQKGDLRGSESITREDLQMPRVALAQSLSPELDETDPKYIEGLKMGDAFNTLTGEVYGKKPLRVVIVRADRPRFVEFNPRDAGGGIKDFDIPANDPRCLFGPNGEKPVATKFVEFVALVGEGLEPALLSFKGSGLKTARQIAGLLKLRQVPAFAQTFYLTPTIQKNSKGTFAVFNVKAGGFVDEQTYKYAEQVYESVKDRAISTDHLEDAPAEEVQPF